MLGYAGHKVTCKPSYHNSLTVCDEGKEERNLGMVVTESLEQADTQPTFFCCLRGD